jgi:hypothetical protein
MASHVVNLERYRDKSGSPDLMASQLPAGDPAREGPQRVGNSVPPDLGYTGCFLAASRRARRHGWQIPTGCFTRFPSMIFTEGYRGRPQPLQTAVRRQL